jgi:tRNA (guanine37-N1)-methyltransferase
MNVTLITLFPEIRSLLEYGVIGRALTRKILNLQTLNPREFTNNVHNTVDDKPYGGGPGMVMKYEPLRDAITTAKTTHTKGTPVIYLSPQGTPLTQHLVNELSANDDLILLAGRYEGIDQRIIDNHVDMEVSIGDYVVSGGELPAIVLLDAVTRMIPGVLDGPLSNQQDSFSRPYFDHPHYTRPEKIDNYSVPPVLLSGNHQAINEWRLKQALTNTWQTRQDLLKRRTLTQSEQEMLDEIEQQLTSKPDD